MVDDETANSYLHVKNIGGRDIVVASRANFAVAIQDGCLPFDADELALINQNKVRLKEDSVVLLVKMYFPRAKLERVKCRTKT